MLNFSSSLPDLVDNDAYLASIVQTPTTHCVSCREEIFLQHKTTGGWLGIYLM